MTCNGPAAETWRGKVDRDAQLRTGAAFSSTPDYARGQDEFVATETKAE